MMSCQAVTLALVISSLAGAAPTAVALDLSTLEAGAFEALDGVALEKTATVRLVQEGFAVVATTASPDVLVSLSVTQTPRAIVLTGTGPSGASARSIPWTGEALPELHLEVTQKLVELTRVVARVPEPVVVPVEPVIAPRRWEVGAAGGVLVREGGVDGLGLVTLRRGDQLRLAVDLGLGGSSGTGIGVFEATLTGGLAYALRFDRWQLEAAVVVGGLLHAWTLSGSSAGTRFSPLVSVPIQLSVGLTPALRLGLRVAPGWSGAREHLNGDVVLWTRGPLRLEALAAVFLAL
jgi:hypothetical protein